MKHRSQHLLASKKHFHATLEIKDEAQYAKEVFRDLLSSRKFFQKKKKSIPLLIRLLLPVITLKSRKLGNSSIALLNRQKFLCNRTQTHTNTTHTLAHATENLEKEREAVPIQVDGTGGLTAAMSGARDVVGPEGATSSSAHLSLSLCYENECVQSRGEVERAGRRNDGGFISLLE